MSNSQPEQDKTPALWWYFFFIFTLIVGSIRLTHAETRPSFFSIENKQATAPQLHTPASTKNAVPLSCRDVPIAQRDGQIAVP